MNKREIAESCRAPSLVVVGRSLVGDFHGAYRTKIVSTSAILYSAKWKSFSVPKQGRISCSHFVAESALGPRPGSAEIKRLPCLRLTL